MDTVLRRYPKPVNNVTFAIEQQAYHKGGVVMDALLPIIDQVEKDLLNYAHSEIDYDRFEHWADHQRFREWCDHRGYSYDRISHPTNGFYYIEGEVKPEDIVSEVQ